MDLPGFKKWIEVQARQVGPAADDAVRRAAGDLLHRLVSYTPVDTGRARAGWRVSVGSPPSGEEPVQLPVMDSRGVLRRRPFPGRQPGRLRTLGTGYPGRPRREFRLERTPILRYGDVPDAEFDRRIAAGDVGGQLVRVRTAPPRPPRPVSPRVAGMLFGPTGATSDAEASNILAALRRDVAGYRSRGGTASLFVYNNVPYVIFLNQGHSPQAAAHWIEKAILETSWEGVRIFER